MSLSNIMKGVSKAKGNLKVLSGGLHSLIVSYPGRIGYWRIGIPPSGPMDDYSFRIANRIIGNMGSNSSKYANAAGLEMAYTGPKLQFNHDTQICLTGARIQNANINDTTDITHQWYMPIDIKSGDILDLSNTNISSTSPGCRTYLSIANGGFEVEEYLGSKTSFPMGKFGGPANDGTVLKSGDVLGYDPVTMSSVSVDDHDFNIFNDLHHSDYLRNIVNEDILQTPQGMTWEIGVLAGPQAAPDYLTEDDVKLLYEQEYEVSHNASRLGIRLNPMNEENKKFSWARTDGGEGGSHPSNLIDNPYPIGSVNFTGDYPVILTVDGPSLGGFVCPITIPTTELWKVGQLKPSDRVRFKLLNLQNVIVDKQTVEEKVECIPPVSVSVSNGSSIISDYKEFEEKRLEPVLFKIEGDVNRNQPKVQYRLGGDKYLLIDYGEDEIDLNLRVRVHKLEEYIMSMCKLDKLDGIIDTIPGVKTLLIEFDPLDISLQYLLKMLIDIEENYLCDVMDLAKNEITLQSRIFNLPFVFNCEWTNAAIQRYMNEVREKAAYLPSNTEFICNNNGLEGGIDELERMIYDISFMVLGLGDVYLGAPCAIPIDPRHRLNVPKYNPSRNFTPEGAVGIGGKFMCIYPMESPGGYQLVGRTLQIFNKTDPNNKPWLLNMFDQVRFYPVTAQELIKQREDNANGKLKFDMTESEWNVNEYNRMYVDDPQVKSQVAKFKENQKKFQAQQLKYDKYLSQQDDIAMNDILCKNILWYQAQMIINGAKYGTSLFIYIKEYFENENDINMKQENFIKPLNTTESQECSIELYKKPYTIKLEGIVKKEDNRYDVAFMINNTKEYVVSDIVLEPSLYVDLPQDQSRKEDTKDTYPDEFDNPNVVRIESVLPGKLVKLHIDIGDEVNPGDLIATVSAMKMETPIHSNTKGVVVFINSEEILYAQDVIAKIQT